jgi:cytosine/adenosine deaminase-related metal-dependent hydrolase
MFLEIVESYGGFDNAHGHLCRADTVTREYLDHIYTSPLEAASLPLSAKQNMTGNLHDGKAYTEENLRVRMAAVIERLISYGTTRFCTCIDVTPDIGEDGQLAFRIAAELKEQYAGRIAIEIGPMPIFGFKRGTERWNVFAKAAEKADFVALLPEKDDYSGRSDRDGKIGYREHLREGINLARALHKPVQIHVDQANDPRENGTEILIEGLKGWVEQPKISGHDGPTIWLIHDISSAAYAEDRYAYHLNWLVDLFLGVICCPTAALSMRQLRAINCPTHNSIARVLELCKCGVPVLFGSDNICDIYVPQSDGDMLTEMKVLGHAVRLAIPHVLAKLAAGIPLNEVDRSTIGEVLYQDSKVFARIDSSWKSAVDLR